MAAGGAALDEGEGEQREGGDDGGGDGGPNVK